MLIAALTISPAKPRANPQTPWLLFSHRQHAATLTTIHAVSASSFVIAARPFMTPAAHDKTSTVITVAITHAFARFIYPPEVVVVVESPAWDTATHVFVAASHV
jgi:hypothetical protein